MVFSDDVSKLRETIMKATPENKVKAKLKAYLDTIPKLFHYSATAGIYSTGGIPDIVGVHNGRFFAIEVKAPGRRGERNRGASALQMQCMAKIYAANGFTMVYDGEEVDQRKLEAWIG